MNPMARKGPRDSRQAAFDIVARSTDTLTTDDLAKSQRTAKGGKARAGSLADEQRSEIAKVAAAKRWAAQS